MNFSSVIKKKNRLLLPVSWLYKMGVYTYHKLYDWKIFKTERIPLPLICVGNLAVGGTGKSPMTEYLLRLLKDRYNVATISRGYKRSTSGFIVAGENTTANEIGDEPMQFHTKFPDVLVTVGENRVLAAKKLVELKPNTDVIVLDDAFQHRAIEAGLNILLTEYGNLFAGDYYLPAGQLRDLKSNAGRAQIIVVTKCPDNLSENERQEIIRNIKAQQQQTVYFTSIKYDAPKNIFTGEATKFSSGVILVTGIANPQPLIKYIQAFTTIKEVVAFKDHHDFDVADIEKIVDKYHQMQAPIITTEKDAVKLLSFKDKLKGLPLCAIPMAHHFLFNEKEKFDAQVTVFIENFTI